MAKGLTYGARRDSPCAWCGGVNDRTCFCGGCNQCGWYHDGGSPRGNAPKFRARGLDQLVHGIQWVRGIFWIPTCWPGLPHLDPYPKDVEFRRVDEPITCLSCLGT